MVVDKKRKDGCESHTFENHEKRDNSFSQEFFYQSSSINRNNVSLKH